MPLINRLSTGRIFFDDFDGTTLNPIWQMSPTDATRYDLNNEKAGHLRMKHGDVPLYALMDMPNKEDFVFEIENDYMPMVPGDTGGIVVYRDNDSRMELLEYYDSALNANNGWTHMRVTKNGEVYTGYGSSDNGKTWSIIGTGTAEAMSKIGLVVNYNAVTGSVPFDVDRVKVFTSTRFIVGNLAPGLVVELLDETGNVAQTKMVGPTEDLVTFDLLNLPIPFTGNLRVKEGSLIKETSAQIDMWGGDVFWYGLLVEVYMDNALLDTDTEKPLGHMTNGIIEKTFKVKNPGSEPILGVKIAKAPYFEYSGYDWVKLAEDIGGYPGDYLDEVEISSLQPGEIRTYWIRIEKQFATDLHLVGNHKFLLQVTN